MEDLYATLGVSRTASTEEIRKAYRTLARKHHPDANPGDAKAEERFKEISHAHDVLSGEESRREYDVSLAMGRRRPPGAGAPGGAGETFGDFADMFSDLFRGGRGGRTQGGPIGARRGGDVEVELSLTFEQAMGGAKLPVTVRGAVPCPECGGSGARAGSSPRLCPDCKGRGVTGRDAGSFAFSQPCGRCGGNGTVIDDPCSRCRGVGSEESTTQISVKIPPGVRDGTRIRLRGKGQAGVGGGPPGDLEVVTRVAPSGRFERRGDDLVVEVPVSIGQAALGTSVEVPTLEGRIKLRVPAGSQDGRALRVPGKGSPRLKGGGAGDLIATVRVRVPTVLTDRQRELLQELVALDDNPGGGG